MATSAPKPGVRYRFTGTDPDDEFGGIGDARLGSDDNAMRVGTEVVVRELVEAGTPGAHNDRDDAVVVDWEQPVLVFDEDDNPSVTTAPRATAIDAARFADLFEKVA